MNATLLTRLYAGLIITIMALIVVHAPLQVFFGTLAPEYSLIIKAWKEILMLLAVPLAVIALTQKHRWRELTHDRLFWVIVAYAVLHLVSLVQWQGVEAVLAGLIIDLRYLLFFGLVYVLVRLYPEYARPLKPTVIAGAVVVLSFGMIQLALPYDALRVIGYGPETIQPYTTVDRNYDFVRYQSTLRGPNPYGAFAASAAIMALAWLTTKRRDWRVAALGLVAVIATYLSHSRSAFIALGAGAFVVLVLRFGKLIKLWQWASLAVIGVAIVVAGFMLRDTDFVSNVVLHEDPEEGNNINSNDGHWKSLVSGTNRMLNEPFGTGVGSTGSASLLSDTPLIIENQYLLIAHEVGWLGLGLFVAIYVIVMRRLWRLRANAWALGVFASGIGLALIGVLLPVWVDDTVSIVWWGMAAAVLAHKPLANGRRVL